MTKIFTLLAKYLSVRRILATRYNFILTDRSSGLFQKTFISTPFALFANFLMLTLDCVEGQNKASRTHFVSFISMGNLMMRRK